MKSCSLPLAALAVLALSGCGPSNSQAPSGSASSQAPSGPRVVEITANDTMKYSLTRIEAKPGEQLTVVLTNAGTLPKEVMGHDWILLKAGSDVEKFDAEAIKAKDTDFVPAALKDEILAQIPLLGPRKSGEVTFTAPTAPGEYTYLCTFPAHYQAGMHGVLVVK
jgi:azurin